VPLIHEIKSKAIDLNNGSPSILAVPVYGWCKLFG